MNQIQQKAADTAVVSGWLGYLVSHLEQINGLLQTLLLIFSIIGTVVAIRYHLKRTPK